MKKWMRFCASVLCAAGLLTITAFALEDTAEPDVFYEELKPFSIAWTEEDDRADLFGDFPAWDADDTKYGDVLTGTARELYDGLEENFANAVYDLSSYGRPAMICSVSKTFTATGSNAFNTMVEERDLWFDTVRAVVFDAMKAFTYDHPEYYWIRTDFAAGFGGGGTYGTNWAEGTGIAKMQFHVPTQCLQTGALDARIEDAANTILAGCEDLPTVGKLAYFDNWLAANNAYNYAAANGMDTALQEDGRTWSILSGLLPELSPVCEGYAKSFQYLCHKSDIPCVTLSSENHMWNAVQVDGLWYVVDSTFNDQGNYSWRDYFMVNAPTEDSHILKMTLPTPDIAEKDYFGSWRLENGTIRGGQTYAVAPDMWFALYDEQGKMIALDRAQSFAWFPSTNMYCAPAFDAADLKDAVRIELYQFGSDWMPTKASTKITE